MSAHHHRAKPKRNKPYRPRAVRIPVTGLRDEFGITLYGALPAVATGSISRKQFDNLGQAFNTLWGALYLRPPKDESVMRVIESAMRAMNDVGRRGDATGVWQMRELEQASVLAGIHKAEEHLPKMNVMDLYNAMQKFKTMPADNGITHLEGATA
jgi:hypothetical protein